MLVHTSHARSAVLTEMVARLFKGRVRKECWAALSKGKGLSDKVPRERVAWFLSLVFGRSKDGDYMWDQVQSELGLKFEKYRNLSQEQVVLLSEWEAVAEILRKGELHEREYQLRVRTLSEGGLTGLEKEEKAKLDDAIKEVTQKEAALRAKIDSLMVHVRDQIMNKVVGNLPHCIPMSRLNSSTHVTCMPGITLSGSDLARPSWTLAASTFADTHMCLALS